MKFCSLFFVSVLAFSHQGSQQSSGRLLRLYLCRDHSVFPSLRPCSSVYYALERWLFDTLKDLSAPQTRGALSCDVLFGVFCFQILLGLDNAGKTTVTAAMKGSVITEASPTWGLNHNKLVVGKVPQLLRTCCRQSQLLIPFLCCTSTKILYNKACSLLAH